MFVRTGLSPFIYLHDYATAAAVIAGLKEFFVFHNAERQHQALDYRTPSEVYVGKELPGGILCAA